MADEKELIHYRAELKAKLKKECMRATWNPERHAKSEGGHVFDPALQRYMSMRATQSDYFKPTRKSAFTGLMAILPIVIFAFVLKRDREFWEEKYSTGQISYAARRFKFV